MDNHGFYECKSSAEVLEVFMRLPIEELVKVEKQYGSSGCELAVQIMKSKGVDETKDLSSDILSNGEIDKALIRLAEKQIKEQIRSNKVIEGILKDIYNAIDRLSDKEI